jgi:hypothetical protein
MAHTYPCNNALINWRSSLAPIHRCAALFGIGPYAINIIYSTMTMMIVFSRVSRLAHDESAIKERGRRAV